MSNAERKKIKFKIILAAVSALILLLICVFALRAFGRESVNTEAIEEGKDTLNFPFENIKVEYKKGDELLFSLKLEKEAAEDFLREKGVEPPFVLGFMPRELEVSGIAKIHMFSEDGKVSLHILQMNINRFEIPSKLLSDIGELKLDFERSLVYN